MQVWRLTRLRHIDSLLSGEGARRFGGRWNSRGVPVVYAAASLELALLESLVHLDLDLVPQDYWQVCFEVPDADVMLLEPLPPGWDDPPPYHEAAQAVGDGWAKAGASLALAVPSALLPARRNLLINPRHPGIARVREVERAPLRWPAALVGRLER